MCGCSEKRRGLQEQCRCFLCRCRLPECAFRLPRGRGRAASSFRARAAPRRDFGGRDHSLHTNSSRCPMFSQPIDDNKVFLYMPAPEAIFDNQDSRCAAGPRCAQRARLARELHLFAGRLDKPDVCRGISRGVRAHFTTGFTFGWTPYPVPSVPWVPG